MTNVASPQEPKALPAYEPVHPAKWTDPAPPTFACFLKHFDTLADRYERLAAECRGAKVEFERQIQCDRPLTATQMRLARRISCQITTEGPGDHEQSQALLDIFAANDDLYFDVVRLSGEYAWDAGDCSWESAAYVAQRRARAASAQVNGAT